LSWTCSGYLDRPFLKTICNKKTTSRSEGKLAARVCLSRRSSYNRTPVGSGSVPR
jgi:hypothetical protein